MSFNTLRETQFYATILNTDAFAEYVTLREPGRDARSIVAKINLHRDAELADLHELDSETLKVAVGRNPDHAKGGIAMPRRGTTIERAGDGRLLVFAGTILEETPYSWLLEFVRRVPEQLGTPAR